MPCRRLLDTQGRKQVSGQQAQGRRAGPSSPWSNAAVGSSFAAIGVSVSDDVKIPAKESLEYLTPLPSFPACLAPRDSTALLPYRSVHTHASIKNRRRLGLRPASPVPAFQRGRRASRLPYRSHAGSVSFSGKTGCRVSTLYRHLCLRRVGEDFLRCSTETNLLYSISRTKLRYYE